MTLRLVLVDDDARFRAVACRALLAEGIDVVATVGSGAEALDVIAQLKPDVALLDIQMPDVDGLEVARRLKRRGGAPVVILISTRDQAYGERLAAGLAAGYLPKDQLSLAAIMHRARPAQ
jgi:CheY-like chemotaxis protein